MRTHTLQPSPPPPLPPPPPVLLRALQCAPYLGPGGCRPPGRAVQTLHAAGLTVAVACVAAPGQACCKNRRSASGWPSCTPACAAHRFPPPAPPPSHRGLHCHIHRPRLRVRLQLREHHLRGQTPPLHSVLCCHLTPASKAVAGVKAAAGEGGLEHAGGSDAACKACAAPWQRAIAARCALPPLFPPPCSASLG